MSLKQWFFRKTTLNNEKSTIPTASNAPGSSKFVIGAIFATLLVATIAYFIPIIQQWARATAWQTPTAFDSTGNVGLYGSTALTSSNLVATTYYDKTNKTIKYAERASNGTWTIENIETFGLDYAGGVNSDKNTKFGIALSPADSKMSVAYCNYAQGGLATQSDLRFAHRVGGGAGNCGTSNNWSCSGVSAFYNNACSMRQISLAYTVTSTQPALAYIDGSSLKYAEYSTENAISTWIHTTVIDSGTGLTYDQNQTVLSFLSNGAPIIFFVQNDGASVNYVKYTYRSNDTWTWSAPATILSDAWTGAITHPYALSVVKDQIETDLFHISAGLSNNLKYTTLNSSFVVGSVTTVETGPYTWNSIMLQASGYPSIAYYDYTSDALKYAAYNGASWVVESVAASMGAYVSMVPGASSSYPNMTLYDEVNGNAVYVTQDNAPTAPTTPYTSTTTPAVYGATNPTQIATTTPSFSAIFQDPDSGDTSAKAQIQLTTATDGFATINIWDSGATAFAPAISVGARSQYFKYGEFGAAPLFAGLLSLGDDGFVTNADTEYYWRIRFYDQNDVAGEWSATNTFTLLDRPAAPSSLALNIPYPYTVANSATTTKNNAYPHVADSVVLTMSTDGATYTTVVTTTVDRTSSTNSITIPTDIFTLDTKYYLKAHYYNILGVSNSTSDSVFNAFREPVITTTTQTCNSLEVTAVDPHFSGSSSFGFQYRNNVLGTYFNYYPSSTQTLSSLTPGGVYSITVYLTPSDLNAPGVPTYGSSSITGQLLACTPSVTVSQTGANTALVSWDGQGSDAGVYYVVKNITTNEQVTVSESDPHNWSFTGLEAMRTYSFSVQSYNSANETNGVATTVSLTMAGASFSQEQVFDYPPTGNFKVYQQGVPAGFALSANVLLDLTSAGAGWLQISNSPDFTGAQWLTVPTPLIKGIPWKLTNVDPVAKSTHSVYVKLLNKTGLKEIILPPETITVDPTGIASPIFMLPQEGASVGNHVVYSGTAKPGVLVKLSTFDRPGMPIVIGETTASDRGLWSITSDVVLTDGMHVIEAVSVAQDGTTSIPAKLIIYVSANVVILPQAPVVEYPKQGSTILPETIITNGFAEPFAQIIIKNYSGNIQDIDTVLTEADANGRWSVKLPIIPGEGYHSYSYYAKNDKGLISSVTVVSFNISTTPAVPPEEILPVPVKNIEPLPVVDKIAPIIRDIPVVIPVPPVSSLGKETSEPAPTSPTVITNVVSSGPVATPTETPTAPVVVENAIQDLKTTANDLLDATISIFNPGTVEATPVQVVETVAAQTKVVAKQAVKSAQKTAQVARIVADTPEVQTANKVVVVPAAAAVGVASVSTAANVPQMLLYLRFLFTQPFALLNRRRHKQWGMVYNAITKMPIDLAVVRLVDVVQGRVVQSKVTDRAGRYHFFAEPGKYKIEITKSDFNFPPTYLQGKKEDGNVTDLYLGAEIIMEKAGSISFNIPLDPIGAVKTTKQILKESAKKHIAEVLSVMGVMVTGVSFVVTPTPLVGAFLVAHVGSFLLFRRLSIGKRPTGWGFVLDASDQEPLERAVVRIFDTQYSKLLETQVTDNKGRYGFLVGKNQYYVMAEHPGHKKFVSDPIEIKNEKEGGIVGIDIKLQQDSNLEKPVELKIETPNNSVPVDNKIQYIPKPEIVVNKPDESFLLKNIQTKTQEPLPVIPTKPQEEVVTFSRVEPFTKKIVSQTPEIEKNTSKLLAPISFASNNLKISGIEKNIDHLPEIISDGNFLNGLDKKI